MSREMTIAISRRARLVVTEVDGGTMIIGLDTCGGPALLMPDGSFASCSECGRSPESLAKLVVELDNETHDPSAADAPLVERLGTGPALNGPSVIVTDALGLLVQNPTRDAVCVALRKLAEDIAHLDALDRKNASFEAVDRLKRLGVTAAEAQQLVAAATNSSKPAVSDTELQGSPLALDDPRPWPEPVDGVELADEIAAMLTRYVVLPTGATEAITLWVFHAHALDAAAVSPILGIVSAEKRSGKSTLLTLLSALVPRPMMSSNVTAPTLFRAVDRYSATVLADEADTFIANREELRGILNAGFLRTTANVPRCEGDAHEPRMFSTWAAKAVAMIGRLPGTLEDRAILVQMRRRASGERVERLRFDRLSDFEHLRRRACRWAHDLLDELRRADPKVPTELHDRAQDCWRPLLAVADMLDGRWPERARSAALALTTSAPESDSSGEMLLADLREIFEQSERDRVSSAELVARLVALTTRPWAGWSRGREMTQAQLARLLRRFQIAPRTMRLGRDEVAKGYYREDFIDAWSRYLPAHPCPTRNSVTSSDPRTQSETAEPLRTGGTVTAPENTEPAPIAACNGVTDGAVVADPQPPVTLADGPLRDYLAGELQGVGAES